MTAATPDDRAVARVLTDRIPGLLPRPELVSRSTDSKA